MPAPVYQLDRTCQSLLETEWLLPDGLGGFAMGTALGTPTRRYHGLLIAATRPPVGRVAVLTQIAERLVLDSGDQPVWLTPFHFHDAPDRPRRSDLLDRFSKGTSWCQWLFRPGSGCTIEKRVDIAHAHNAVRVRYRIHAPAQAGILELRPLLSLRDFHALHRRRLDEFAIRHADQALIAATPEAGVLIETDRLERSDRPELWEALYFEREADRGQDCVENLLVPATYRLRFEGPCEASLFFSAEVERTAATFTFDEPPIVGLDHVLSRIPSEDQEARNALQRLTEAAGAFVVRRSGSLDQRPAVSIIAGYPWFADWGRDTMIALPGLLLETGRFDEALSTLELFASHMHRGLIPNRFDDYAGGAHYNTVDASLWFVHAATEYLLRTQDDTGFARLIEPCLEIIEAYQRGTDYNIHLDDGLIAAGSPSTQLTWMDAQRDGVTFTPRYGKCVEINALWHHGLRRLSRALAGHTTHRTVELDTLAARCAERFTRLFNNPAGGLYDRLEPTASGYRPVDEIRPNQIFAASLADAPLDHAGRASVVKTVRRELLTPFGLRTLAPSDPAYIGHYRGNLFERDRAYHNGTVWPWLIGPFVEAALRVDPSQHARTSLRALLQPLTDRMNQVCLGQVGEICDGDEPHTPDGCPAQAWSVAELLRAWIMLASNSTSRPTKDPR